MEISSVSNMSQYYSSGESSMSVSAEEMELIEETVTAGMETAELMGDLNISMLKQTLETAQMSSLRLLQGGLDMYI